jgi:hypothetical protein
LRCGNLPAKRAQQARLLQPIEVHGPQFVRQTVVRIGSYQLLNRFLNGQIFLPHT